VEGVVMIHTIKVEGEQDVFIDMDLTWPEYITMTNFVIAYETERIKTGATYAAHISMVKKEP
jgi:hypothetical protein